METVDAKRLKLVAAPPASDAGDLADVLSRLADTLRSTGSGQAEGLDELLDELGRLQFQLNSSSDQAFKAIADAQEKLQVGAPPPPPLAPPPAACPPSCVPAAFQPARHQPHLVRPTLAQAAIVALQAAVDRLTPPPGYRPPAPSDEAAVRALLSYAHRLSYSSSAPLGYQPGQPLYFFKAPAPQEADMRASQLHTFARE